MGWSLVDEELGLISNRVKDVALDDKGRLWVVHAEGVSFLDSREWTDYRNQQSGTFSGICEAIGFDSQGRAWVAHSRGVSVLEDGRWTQYDAQELGLGEDYLVAHDIVADGQGRVWVATTSGVTVFDDGEWRPFDETSGLLSGTAKAIAIGEDGRVWVGHSSGVSVFDGSQWVNHGGHPKADVKVGLVGVEAVAVGGDGTVWVVTWSGDVASLCSDQWTVYDSSNSGLLGGRGTAIATDARGRVWIGTDWHLTVYDGEEWFSYTSTDSGLPPDGVTAIAFSGPGPAALP
jgi:ligand-binding sensor domain-containing protein